MWELVGALAASLAALWAALALALWRARPGPGALSEALRLLPDTLRMLRGLATDPEVPRGARAALWLLLGYLALPFDLIPDFLPVIGHADDAIVACLVLRAVARRAGPGALARHWPGTPRGLAAVRLAAGLPPG